MLDDHLEDVVSFDAIAGKATAVLKVNEAKHQADVPAFDACNLAKDLLELMDSHETIHFDVVGAVPTDDVDSLDACVSILQGFNI